MANGEEKQEQRQELPKRIALREDGYYANCSMLETTAFDIAILFGKVRTVADPNGQTTLAEVYDRQVYLSQPQARALYEGSGRHLAAPGRMYGESEAEESIPERPTQESSANS